LDVVAWKKQLYMTIVGYGRKHREAEEIVDFCKISL
jgi:hypothetical protein